MKNKYGIENPLEYYNDFWTNKKYGFNQNFIYGAILGIISVTLLTFCILTNKLFELNLNFEKYYIIIFVIFSYLICHFLIFKKDTYLDYFEKFEKWSPKRKRVNIFLSFLFIISVFTALILILK